MIVVYWCGIITLVVGVASIIVTKAKDIRNKSFIKRCSAVAEATIIDVKMKSYVDNGITFVSYYPTVEFYAQNNRIEKKYTPVKSLTVYSKGQKVKVFYNPHKSDEFYLDTDGKKKVTLRDYYFGACSVLFGLFIVTVFLLVKNALH